MATKGESASVQVVVRLRPLNDREKRRGTQPVVMTSTANNTVTVVKGAGAKTFRQTHNFDNVFGSFATQEEVFDATLLPMLDEVLKGFEATAFAYGQTGTGKTHTMEGDIDSADAAGIIPRAARALFAKIESNAAIVESNVSVTFLEVYNEELSDLFRAADDPAQKKLRIVEDKGERGRRGRGVHCMNLKEEPAGTAEELIGRLRSAQERRTVGETKMNKHSSRSHCLFTLTVRTKEHVDGMIMERQGNLHMVDLAGSECAKTAGSGSDTRERERKNINQSLLTLGRVITALRDGGKTTGGRIPYRDSKLTRLLQESLGGRCKTVIIATASPSVLAVDETVKTLDYAARAMGIKNKPVSSMSMHSMPTSIKSVGGGSSGGSDGKDSGIDSKSNSGGAGGGSIDSFREMEMRMQYLTSELEEARSALARKHTLQQEAVDRADMHQKRGDELQEQLEKARSQLDETIAAASLAAKAAHEKEAALNATIRAREAALAEEQGVCSAHMSAATDLRVHAAGLISTLRASLADGDVLHSELVARNERESELRRCGSTTREAADEALRAACAELQAVLDAQRTSSESLRSNAETAAAQGAEATRGMRAQGQKLAEAVASLAKGSLDATGSVHDAAIAARRAFAQQQREKVTKDAEAAACIQKSIGDALTASQKATHDEESRLVAWAKDVRDAQDETATTHDAKFEAENTEAEATATAIRTRQEQRAASLAAQHEALEATVEGIATTIAEPLAQYKESQTSRRDVQAARAAAVQLALQEQAEALASVRGAHVAAAEQHRKDADDYVTNARVQAESGVTTTREALTTHAEALRVLAADISSANAAATHSEELEAARKEAEAAAQRAASALDALHEAATAARTAEADSNADEKLKERLGEARATLAACTDKHEAALGENCAGLRAMSATLGNAEQQHGKDLERAAEAEQQAAQQLAAEQRGRINRQRTAASEQQKLVDALREEHEQTQKALVTNAVEVLTATLQASSKQLIETLEGRLVSVMEQTNAMSVCGDEIEEAETVAEQRVAATTASVSATAKALCAASAAARKATEGHAVAIENSACDARAAFTAFGGEGGATTELESIISAWGDATRSVGANCGRMASDAAAAAEAVRKADTCASERNAAMLVQAKAWGAANNDAQSRVVEATNAADGVRTAAEQSHAALLPITDQISDCLKQWSTAASSVQDGIASAERSNANLRNAESKAELEAEAAAEAATAEMAALETAVDQTKSALVACVNTQCEAKKAHDDDCAVASTEAARAAACRKASRDAATAAFARARGDIDAAMGARADAVQAAVEPLRQARELLAVGAAASEAAGTAQLEQLETALAARDAADAAHAVTQRETADTVVATSQELLKQLTEDADAHVTALETGATTLGAALDAQLEHAAKSLAAANTKSDEYRANSAAPFFADLLHADDAVTAVAPRKAFEFNGDVAQERARADIVSELDITMAAPTETATSETVGTGDVADASTDVEAGAEQTIATADNDTDENTANAAEDTDDIMNEAETMNKRDAADAENRCEPATSEVTSGVVASPVSEESVRAPLGECSNRNEPSEPTTIPAKRKSPTSSIPNRAAKRKSLLQAPRTHRPSSCK